MPAEQHWHANRYRRIVGIAFCELEIFHLAPGSFLASLAIPPSLATEEVVRRFLVTPNQVQPLNRNRISSTGMGIPISHKNTHPTFPSSSFLCIWIFIEQRNCLMPTYPRALNRN
jgi:hypothetical protein